MRPLLLLAVLLLSGCGLSYELHLPDIFQRPAHVTRGELLQRELYASDCTYVFGEKLLGSGATEAPIATQASDIQVVVAGGPGKHSCWMPTFGGDTRPVHRLLEL